MGLIAEIVPALKIDGKFIANPLVEISRFADEYGRIIFGKLKTGDALKAGQELIKRGKVDLSLLDERVEALCTKLLYTFPDCTTKTVEELRKPKLDIWNRNKENSRAWLALNMMTEGRAGFRAFNEGTKDTGREIDFIALRRALADNRPWSDELTASIMPRKKA
jgi:6-oxo-cyclohex-1-ene-carbonyl-CoA hydrolase